MGLLEKVLSDRSQRLQASACDLVTRRTASPSCLLQVILLLQEVKNPAQHTWSDLKHVLDDDKDVMMLSNAQKLFNFSSFKTFQGFEVKPIYFSHSTVKKININVFCNKQIPLPR